MRRKSQCPLERDFQVSCIYLLYLTPSLPPTRRNTRVGFLLDYRVSSCSKSRHTYSRDDIWIKVLLLLCNSSKWHLVWLVLLRSCRQTLTCLGSILCSEPLWYDLGQSKSVKPHLGIALSLAHSLPRGCAYRVGPLWSSTVKFCETSTRYSVISGTFTPQCGAFSPQDPGLGGQNPGFAIKNS